MLRRVYIENFLLIKDLEIEFAEGLNVISGETGTGKSMTISAVGFVMGKQGEFPEGTAVELEIESEGDTYLLRREIRNGRSRYYLNGRGTTAKVVRDILEGRISVQGQNEFVKLLRHEFHRELLDVFGGLKALREEVERLFQEYSSLKADFENLLKKREETLQKRDFLEFKLREIEEIGVRPEELQEMRRKAERLKAQEKIKRLVSESIDLLYGGESSAYFSVSSALKNLWRLRDLDPSFESLAEELTLLKDKILDVSEELKGRDFELSQEEIDYINETLFKVQRIEKKYGKPYEEVVKEAEQIKEELKLSYNFDDILRERRSELESLERKVFELAKKLSSERKKVARRLEKDVEAVLKELNLERASLRVALERGELGRFGFDRVKFLFSSFGGEPLPLEDVASGGELTRLFLALSLILPPSETYILDEVDVGISGESSLKLAKLLKKLSKNMQVIVITHSAPICAAGDVNFLTEKEFLGNLPYIRIRRLSGEEKLVEIARLMGTPTENTIKGAKELVDIINS